ncbi:2-acylglycerol O-acyltransferase 1-like [Amphiura filiformis]|uniref:2-acylglycerol O-acyltransferase 1-like n=1 Tax=Amphiura filiformis TaxID=82378 RepID=UPI003B212F08
MNTHVIFYATSCQYQGTRMSSSAPETKEHYNHSNVKFLGLELAPLHIPWHRRMETVSVIHWLTVFLFSGFICIGFCIYLLYTNFYWVSLLTFAWVYYDRKCSRQGGRRFESVRKWRVWMHTRNYFPISLHKTSDLDPKNNYVFGFHPHGIMSMGAFINFSTDATGFDEKFPGIKGTVLTLQGWFYIPFIREYLLAASVCDVSRDSIDWILGKSGTGNAAVVVVGGATESLEANPNVHRLYLSRRKGFIKRAIVNGAHLVPVYSFGETDVFVQMPNPEGSRLRKLQAYLTKYIGFAPPVFHGRGIFNYSMGLIPYRRPIHTVVGAPIPTKKSINPSNEEVEAVHKEYMDALVSLFEEHKTKYGIDKDKKLVII